ncbi:unnamed protein product [Phytophthora lilii]|uniref:Unnamed protein product n=1 Tax=Phytophthora lilii TaxID=2077276 RepID=A0A9W6WQA5_9STRA|nr:unnamed protein product [Phytophthora lilii]
MIGTGGQLRMDLSLVASQVIHMMQKFHRIGTKDSILDPVRELCGTTLDFTTFVIRTARISLSVKRKVQAVEIMDVLEKRLLNTSFVERRRPRFREIVLTYSFGRRMMNLFITSSSDATRHLAWYLSDAVKKYDCQMDLDKLAGWPFYFELKLTTDTSDLQIEALKNAISSTPELNGVMYFGDSAKRVVYGSSSKVKVKKTRDFLLDVVRRIGIQFDEQGAQFCTATIQIGKFVFSAAGILRVAAAA